MPKSKKKANPLEMTPEERRVWAKACKAARQNFDLKQDGLRVSYAAGYHACYMKHLKKIEA